MCTPSAATHDRWQGTGDGEMHAGQTLFLLKNIVLLGGVLVTSPLQGITTQCRRRCLLLRWAMFCVGTLAGCRNICVDGWDNEDAAAACRSVGYSAGGEMGLPKRAVTSASTDGNIDDAIYTQVYLGCTRRRKCMPCVCPMELVGSREPALAKIYAPGTQDGMPVFSVRCQSLTKFDPLWI